MEIKPGDWFDKTKLQFSPNDVINWGGFDSPPWEEDLEDYDMRENKQGI
jgi:hypothetical protein